MRAETPFVQREFFLKSSHPSFLIKRAAPLISVFFNGLYAPFGSPVSGGQKPQGRRGKPPSVLYLPHLSSIVFTTLSVPLVGDRNPSGRGLNPLPSPRPFQKGKGCNRPPVLRTATLYGCRTIKGLRHVVRDGTAWRKVETVWELAIMGL